MQRNKAVARPMPPDAPVISMTLSAIERPGWAKSMAGYVEVRMTLVCEGDCAAIVQSVEC